VSKFSINNLYHSLFKGFSENRFSNLGYLPRWIIVCIDVGFLFLASYFTYLIVTSLTLRYYDTYSVSIRYAIIVFANVFCFIVYRTYAGIIRHSSFIDALKLFSSTFSAFVILVVLNYLHFFITGNKIYLFPALVIHFVISFILLFLFRLVVKFLFEKYLTGITATNLTKVLIYGADANAVALANAITLEQPKKYQLMGFIGDKNSRFEKEMLGVPILNKKKSMATILESVDAKAIILADKSISKEDKIKLVESCLELNCKVLTAPVIKDWEDQKDISKTIKTFDIQDLLERQPIVLDNQQIGIQVKDKTILVTGAAGSIGSEIVYQLLAYHPKKVLLLDQAETPLHHLFLELTKLQLPIEIVPLIADIKDQKIVQFIFETHKPQLVYHAAAYKHVPLMEENPYQAIMTNCIGTKNLADTAILHHAERFVMVSTDKAVNPSNVMGASKRIAEVYVQSLYLDLFQREQMVTKFITTRFGNVLGSNGSVVPLFTKQIEAGGPVTITHPDIIRYFMTIPEACQLVLEAGAMGNGGEIYIFDMGKPVRIIDLATKMIRLAGLVPEKDIPIAITGLRPGEKLYEELLHDSSKSLVTHHEKILIAKELSSFDYPTFNQLMDTLQTTANELEFEEAVRVMKKMVPEFKSQNSIYEELDS
jgi:FlaA1/EpsC-like NDP-sugar epimerase